MIPPLNFPDAIDNDLTLFAVKDSLRLTLAADYNVGDKSISVEDNQAIMSLFPSAGIITLVENCSEPEKRAISFYYTSRTTVTFDGLSLLEDFIDSYKPKNVTNVVQNVMAEHHNALKNAVLAIQNYIGLKGDTATVPLRGTVGERLNYLQSVAYSPKAWFTADTTLGIIPLTVNFTDESFRLGKILNNNNITFVWDFGDSTASVISYTEMSNSGNATHVYQRPGIFDVTLKVTNKFSNDTLKLPGLVNARYPAPDFAVIDYILGSFQIFLNDQIKSPNNIEIELLIPTGINPLTGRTYSGEEVDSSDNPIDPISEYEWLLSDALSHANSKQTKALYSSGGIYDLVIKATTVSKSYRITSNNDFINIVENNNIWLLTFDSLSTTSVRASEFGFISQTFKTRQSSNLTISVNDGFLSGTNNSEQAIREFKRNVFFSSSSSQPSGYSGTSNIYYASGRNTGDATTLEKIKVVEYNGFNETYANIKNIDRPWNWIAFNNDFETYLLFGNPVFQPTGLSLTNQTLTIHNQLSNTAISTNLSVNNYISGGAELQQNPVQFEADGCTSIYGYFSVYRSAWRERNGYIVRNSGVGTFFQLKSFYGTQENGADLIYYFSKLNDMAGTDKKEGQLLNLSSGLYFFDNSGAVSAYDPVTQAWQTGGTGVNSIEFQKFQDSSKKDFNLETNTLLAVSDGSHSAYLSYDYSSKSFLRFTDTDLTFSLVGERPDYNQWCMGTF